MTKQNVPSLRHHSAHPATSVKPNLAVNKKPEAYAPPPSEKATAKPPVMNSGAPVIKANAGMNPAKTVLPVAQNNPSLGGIVSGRDVGLDTVNSRLGRVPNPDDENEPCDSDEDGEYYCEDSEEDRGPVNPLKVS
jgi:hypothetical protein